MTPTTNNIRNLPLLLGTVINSTSLVNHTSVPQLTPTIPASATHVYTSSQSLNSRLPKLTLPVFSGDPLNWQTFWDSFNEAVHTNPALGCIQKFNYLKAQLQGEALQDFPSLSVIINTPLNFQRTDLGNPIN